MVTGRRLRRRHGFGASGSADGSAGTVGARGRGAATELQQEEEQTAALPQQECVLFVCVREKESDKFRKRKEGEKEERAN